MLIPDKYGPINPIKEENFAFLQQFFEEVSNLFPEKYVHMGGDEVNFSCWYVRKQVVMSFVTNLPNDLVYSSRRNHPEIQAFMAANGWAGDDFGKLEQYYFERLMALTQEATRNRMRYVVWQERKSFTNCLSRTSCLQTISKLSTTRPSYVRIPSSVFGKEIMIIPHGRKR